MYSEDYNDEQETTSNGNFITNFYYNNKVLIWIFLGVIGFILLMSLLTKGGSNSGSSSEPEIKIYPDGVAEVSIGNSKKLYAQVTSNANAVIVWSSSDENVAKVDNGNVTGINYGKAVVTATYVYGNNKEVKATKDVVVADGNPNLTLTDVSFRDGDLLMPVGSTYSISLNLTPSNGYVTNKQFTSSNKRVVEVDNTGLVKAVGEGEATVSLNVNDGAFRKDLKVYVSSDYTRAEIIVTPEKIQFDGELRKLKVGSSEKLSYTVFPDDTDKSKLTWTSSDENIVTVDVNGIVRALKEGNATITLKSITGVKDTIDIEVESDIVEVTDINVSLNDLYLTVGQSQTITPVVSPDNASNKALSYNPSDSSVISVAPNQSGTEAMIIGLRAGTTVLTIQANNNVEKRINVTVTGSSSGGSSSGSSGGSSSSSSTQGFKISSRDAENKGYINTTYEKTEPANNGAIAPVVITAEITDSSVAKLRIAVCSYPANDTTCNPSSSSSNVHVIYGSGSFTMSNKGAYVLRVGEYDSNNNLKRIVDKYIWIKTGSSSGGSSSSSSSGSTSTKGGYDVVRTSDNKSLETIDSFAAAFPSAPTYLRFVINNSDISSIKACWAYKSECTYMNKTFTSTGSTEKISTEGLWIVNFTVTYKDNTTKKEKRYIYIKNNNSNNGGSQQGNVSVTSVALNKSSLTLTVGGSETLTATVYPSTATNKGVTWSSSNTNVATVDSNGKVVAKTAGSTKITVTTKDGSKTNSCYVTVKSTQKDMSSLEYKCVGTRLEIHDGSKELDTTKYCGSPTFAGRGNISGYYKYVCTPNGDSNYTGSKTITCGS